MEDKTFDLIAKMYSEFKEFRKETNDKFDGIDKRFDNFEGRFDKLGDQVTRLEDYTYHNVKILHDGLKSVNEKLEVMDNKLDNISAKVEVHDLEIKALKSRDNVKSFPKVNKGRENNFELWWGYGYDRK